MALVGGGPGDAELITVRGQRLLAQADVVVADRLAPPELLAALGPQVEIIDAAKVPYGRAMKQEAINDVPVSRPRRASSSSGSRAATRSCTAAGSRNYRRAWPRRAGHRRSGVSSPIAAPASAGIPVTHRGVTHEVVIASGHVPPAGHPDSLIDWSVLAQLQGTLVLMMAVERVAVFADALLCRWQTGHCTPSR